MIFFVLLSKIPIMPLPDYVIFVLIDEIIEFKLSESHINVLRGVNVYFPLYNDEKFVSFFSIVYDLLSIFVLPILQFSATLVNDVFIHITIFLQSFEKLETFEEMTKLFDFFSASGIVFFRNYGYDLL